MSDVGKIFHFATSILRCSEFRNTNLHDVQLYSPLSHLKTKFPTVRFHPSITENDDDWQPHTRESWQDVSQRVFNFFIWLLHQPHNNVAIVTHGVWMECALLNYCPEILQNGKKRVYNCDVYSGKLSGSSDGKSITLTDIEQIMFDDQ